ncbi:MAG: hypothetical protein IM673_14565 [Phenylobacterium sp.]|jgi:hypothetical protein|uniref:hypothetical protein n=1 Tax=Phenylobacterium sp. TaxID=1871053 RepID=UPI0025DA008E|nr:hypothetical protein [Phenylobacterium sp.]MCA3739261.1 hypothetical protein [Phenylobacterium sp.]MCA3758685.1 hypothetical protein [Phenylobacterium sp.]MCA4916077.1 hypothetical protein [Phenylobacterium sp.]
MRLSVTPVLTTFLGATLAAGFVRMGTWDEIKAGLMTALSVVAAAALVRLARGLPFTNPDHFEPDEVEQITAAVRQLARSLRMFLGVTLVTMAILAMAKPLGNLVGLVSGVLHAPEANLIGHRVLSGLLGGMFAYVAARMWQIVGSDLSLLDKQAEFTERAVHRKSRKRDEEINDIPGATPFQTPEGYGRRLQ